MIRSFSSNKLKKITNFLQASYSRSIATTVRRDDLYDDWKKLAEKQMKGKDPNKLVTETPEVQRIFFFSFLSLKKIYNSISKVLKFINFYFFNIFIGY